MTIPGSIEPAMSFLDAVLSHVDGDRSGFRVDDIAVGDRYVVVREAAELARRDRPQAATSSLPLLLRFSVAGGRIARLDIIPEDAGAYDAFWSPAQV